MNRVCGQPHLNRAKKVEMKRNVLYFDGMFYMLSIHLNNCKKKEKTHKKNKLVCKNTLQAKFQ